MKARGSQPALEEPGIGMPAAAVRQKGNRLPQEVSEMIIVSVNDLADENGWAFLGDVGNLLLKKQPSFDSRNYGYQKLSQLIQAMDRFEIEPRDTANAHVKHILFVKKRRESTNCFSSVPFIYSSYFYAKFLTKA